MNQTVEPRIESNTNEGIEPKRGSTIGNARIINSGIPKMKHRAGSNMDQEFTSPYEGKHFNQQVKPKTSSSNNKI